MTNDTINNATSRPDRLETLREKKAAIEAQIARLNSTAAKEKRKREDHKKFLVGAIVLAEAEFNPKVADWLQTQLSKGLKQARDRAVFNLPPLPDGNNQQALGRADENHKIGELA